MKLLDYARAVRRMREAQRQTYEARKEGREADVARHRADAESAAAEVDEMTLLALDGAEQVRRELVARDREITLRRFRLEGSRLSTDAAAWSKWVHEVAAELCSQKDPIRRASAMVRRAQLAHAMKPHGSARLASLRQLVEQLGEADRDWRELAQVALHASATESLLARGAAVALIDRLLVNPTTTEGAS